MRLRRPTDEEVTRTLSGDKTQSIWVQSGDYTTPESPHQVHCSATRGPVFGPGCSCRYKFQFPGDKYRDRSPY